MTRTSAVLTMITACFVVTAAQQPSSQPPGTERIAALLATGRVSYSNYTDRSLSASVIGQFVSWQPGEIGLAVLLRGTERWYMAGLPAEYAASIYVCEDLKAK